MGPETKSCQNCKAQFAIEPEDFDFYSWIKVPPPTFCPDCRLQRRMTYRNERTLYKDTCDLCGKNMLSMYSPDKPFVVYCKECWYSDKWDPLTYGRDYDWNKPFFQQFRELMEKVPQIAVAHLANNVNCDYTNFVANSKNIYLSQSTVYSENIYYSRYVDKSKDCFDCFNLKEAELCYENVDGSKNYSSKFLVRSHDCIDSAFLFDCVNCQNCFMCSNQRNKQFMVRNKQYSKEEYQAELAKIGKYSQLVELKQEFAELMKKSLHKFANLMKTVHCTGDNIDNSKNVQVTFDAYGSENLKFSTRMITMKDSYDVLGAAHSEIVYEAASAGWGSYNCRFVTYIDDIRNALYTNLCLNSSDLFGCTSVRNKKHCILNKPYSEREYSWMVSKIIKHMDEMPYISQRANSPADAEAVAGKKEQIVYKFGEFFPAELSPWAYNETIAQEYFPLTKEEALTRGYSWRESDPYPHKPTVSSAELPDDIKDVQDSILNEIIGCPVCGRAYRILKPELEFLRQQRIALPRKCQDCRHKDRFALRNPLKLWHRQCVCLSAEALAKADAYRNMTTHFHGAEPCPNEFETSYPPDSPAIVYCEQCYQTEVV